MDNKHDLLIESLFNKINQEFPNNSIITKNTLKNIFNGVELNDKNKIKILYQKIVEKLKIFNNKNEVNVPQIIDKLPKPLEIPKNNFNKDIDITPKKNDEKLETKNIVLNINSSFRDKEKYPNSFNFSVIFNISDAKNEEIKFNLNNIKSFEIKNIILKDSDKLGNFLFLEIDEINSEIVSNNKILKDAFCLLYDYKTMNNFRYYDLNKKINFDIVKTFNKLSFCLKNSMGENIIDNEGNIEIIIEVEKLNVNFFNNFTEYQIKDSVNI